MLRLRDMELMAEKKFGFSVHGACFITGGLVALACQECVRILDQQLLQLHSINCMYPQQILFMPRHLLLVVMHKTFLRYVDISSGVNVSHVYFDQKYAEEHKFVQPQLIQEGKRHSFLDANRQESLDEIKRQKDEVQRMSDKTVVTLSDKIQQMYVKIVPVKMQLMDQTGLVCVSFANQSVLRFYTPSRTEPLYALNTGLAEITDFCFFGYNLVVAGGQFIKIFDCKEWSGEITSVFVGKQIMHL